VPLAVLHTDPGQVEGRNRQEGKAADNPAAAVGKVVGLAFRNYRCFDLGSFACDHGCQFPILAYKTLEYKIFKNIKKK
jgi:hypothetical protein